MAVQTVPTKGNLMNTKKSLALAKNGYELLDRKRNILIREMMTLIDHANAIQQKIDDAYAEAYTALQTANVTNGFCEDISNAIPYEDGLKLDSRSVMGVEIPILTIAERENHNYLHYGLVNKSGAWFSMGDTRLGQGRDAAKQYFKEHPDIADAVQREIMIKVEEERSKNSAGAAVKLSESVATAPAEKPAAPKPSSAKAVSIDADDFDDLDDEE